MNQVITLFGFLEAENSNQNWKHHWIILRRRRQGTEIDQCYFLPMQKLHRVMSQSQIHILVYYQNYYTITLPLIHVLRIPYNSSLSHSTNTHVSCLSLDLRVNPQSSPPILHPHIIQLIFPQHFTKSNPPEPIPKGLISLVFSLASLPDYWVSFFP